MEKLKIMGKLGYPITIMIIIVLSFHASTKGKVLESIYLLNLAIFGMILEIYVKLKGDTNKIKNKLNEEQKGDE